MPSDEERDKFEYQGQLVYNSIQLTDLSSGDAEELRGQLLDSLPSFSTGTPASEGDGYESLDLVEYVENHGGIKEELREVADEIVDLEYKYESYPTEAIEVVDIEGRETRAFPRNIKSAYVFWQYPDYLFIQGSKSKAREVGPKVNAAFGKNVHLTSVEFDPNFLLWLFYKYDNGGRVPGEISIEKLTAAEVEGEMPDFGRNNRIDKSRDVSASLALIAGLLQNMDLSVIEGEFLIAGEKIDADIRKEGRVQVRAGLDLQTKSDLERALIGIKFLTEVSDLYEDWKTMDPTDKIPHPEYFAELREKAVDQDAEFNFDFDELVYHYADLRNENPADYNFDFGIDE